MCFDKNFNLWDHAAVSHSLLLAVEIRPSHCCIVNINVNTGSNSGDNFNKEKTARVILDRSGFGTQEHSLFTSSVVLKTS